MKNYPGPRKVLGTVLQYSYFSVISRFPLKTVHPFRKFLPVLPVLPPPTLYKVETRKKFWRHASNIVCGVRGGVGLVWIGKRPRNTKFRPRVVPHFSSGRVEWAKREKWGTTRSLCKVVPRLLSTIVRSFKLEEPGCLYWPRHSAPFWSLSAVLAGLLKNRGIFWKQKYLQWWLTLKRTVTLGILTSGHLMEVGRHWIVVRKKISIMSRRNLTLFWDKHATAAALLVWTLLVVTRHHLPGTVFSFIMFLKHSQSKTYFI